MTTHESPLLVSDVIAIHAITAAAAAVDSAKRSLSQDAVSSAEDNLRAIIQSANDQGRSWQSIGDTLGITRGNAYQRYRRRRSKTPMQAVADTQSSNKPSAAYRPNGR